MTSPRRSYPEHRLRRRRRSCFMTGGLLLVTFLQVLRHRASSDEQSLEARHPLAGTRRMRALPQLNINGELRYITFGSSTTWGAGLDDYKLAYPFQLSSRVRNVASRMGGAALSAACTETIVGNEMYDVITIEFSRFEESHAVLSKRLRQRFPEASILFVRLWRPENIIYTSTSGETIDLNSWRAQNGGLSIQSSELALLMMEAGPENWHIHVDDEKLLRPTLELVGGLTVMLPAPDNEAFTFPQNLLSFLSFFNEGDHSLLSARGHAALATEIRNVVTTYGPTKGRSVDNVVGSWGSGDQCNVWYYNGNFPISDGRRLTFSLDADGMHKHALEFRPGGGASIRVRNKFEEDRMLFLTYMTAADDEDDKIYPRTRVRINDRAYIVLEPYHERADVVHLARTSAVGMVPSGDSIIYIDPLEASQLDFRLVGASLLSEAALDGTIPVDFELEPEPAAAH